MTAQSPRGDKAEKPPDGKAGSARAVRFLRCLFAALSTIALSFTLAWLACRKGVATDLHSLAGGDSGLLAALAEKTADEIRVLCDDEEREAKCRAVFPFRETPDPARLLDFFAAHSRGLLGAKARTLLEAGDFERLRRSVKRRDYTGMGLFPKSADPFYFLSDHVAALRELMPKGLAGGRELLTANARGHEKELAGLISLAERDDGIALSGSPFHTFLATERSKREINILGGISLAAIMAIGLVLFRSVRFIVPTAAALAAGFLTGALAVFAIFPKPHVLTFLFGSTLIGLGVDYCYHAIADAHSPPRGVRGSLAAALATTALAFSPLLFSSVAILNQMAVFTISGLAAIFLSALAIMARARTAPAIAVVGWPSSVHAVRSPGVAAAKALIIAGVVAGALRLSTSNDPSGFYNPPELLAKGEAKVAEAMGGATAFTVISADTLEEALQKEEEAGIVGPSRLLPSMARQRRDSELIASFAGEPPRGDYLALDDLPPPLRALVDAMMLEHGGRVHLLSPAAAGAKAETIAPKKELERMFAAFADETKKLLAVSFAAMLAAMFALFRGRAVSYAKPMALALAATLGALGWAGEKITFFHMISLFVTVGIGMDYVIFNRAALEVGEGAGTMRAAVFASFLSSLVGFGALAFTSFPPTRAMGETLAIGIFFCYALSLSTPRKRRPADRQDWAAQRERGATRLGILVIWHIYRLLGKTAAKIAFLVPLAFIAPLCRGAGFRRILAFAWSRIDIVDAVTLRKATPRFTFSGDTGWRSGGAFLISSHLGSIEVLAALCDASRPELHAFQQVSHDPVFTSFLTERMSGFTLHAVEEIGVETAVEMQEALRAGALVLMAGDRLPAKTGRDARTARHGFLGRECLWPRGVFRFAALMESPVYAIVAVRTGWNRYEVKAKRLGGDLLHDYVSFLEEEVRRRPGQWFQFHDMPVAGRPLT